MTIKITALLIFTVAPLFAVCSAAAPIPATVDQLAWLSGCWASAAGEPGSEEHWMQPAAGTMLGMNRFVRQGQTVAFEFMRIYEDAKSLHQLT